LNTNTTCPQIQLVDKNNVSTNTMSIKSKFSTELPGEATDLASSGQRRPSTAAHCQHFIEKTGRKELMAGRTLLTPDLEQYQNLRHYIGSTHNCNNFYVFAIEVFTIVYRSDCGLFRGLFAV